MSRIVLLDSTPLGMVTNPRATPENQECRAWLASLIQQGIRIYVPEIADYEIRRELIRGEKHPGIQRLNQLAATIGYLPLTTATMHRAAELWARIRRQRLQTADDKALAGDVILAAQALMLTAPDTEVIIATSNVGHLGRLARAAEWRDIK